MRNQRRMIRLVSTVLTGGTVLGTACSAIDVRHNMVAGTMDFIAGYTADLLAAIVPSPEELLGADADDD